MCTHTHTKNDTCTHTHVHVHTHTQLHIYLMLPPFLSIPPHHLTPPHSHLHSPPLPTPLPTAHLFHALAVHLLSPRLRPLEGVRSLHAPGLCGSGPHEEGVRSSRHRHELPTLPRHPAALAGLPACRDCVGMHAYMGATCFHRLLQ